MITFVLSGNWNQSACCTAYIPAFQYCMRQHFIIILIQFFPPSFNFVHYFRRPRSDARECLLNSIHFLCIVFWFSIFKRQNYCISISVNYSNWDCGARWTYRRRQRRRERERVCKIHNQRIWAGVVYTTIGWFAWRQRNIFITFVWTFFDVWIHLNSVGSNISLMYANSNETNDTIYS